MEMGEAGLMRRCRMRFDLLEVPNVGKWVLRPDEGFGSAGTLGKGASMSKPYGEGSSTLWLWESSRMRPWKEVMSTTGGSFFDPSP